MREDLVEKFERFRRHVEEKGFFLGLYREDGRDHLVVTKNPPTPQKEQYAVFMFPWVNISVDRGFLAPQEMVKIQVAPIEGPCSLAISVEDAIVHFEKAASRLSEATKFFEINMHNKPADFSALISSRTLSYLRISNKIRVLVIYLVSF